MLGLLDQGVIPNIPIRDRADLLNVSTGSLYAHFPGGAGELDGAVIGAWAMDNWGTPPGPEVSAVRNPVERLRALMVRGQHKGPRDGTMRRWAADNSAAAAAARAVAALDGSVVSQERQKCLEAVDSVTAGAVAAADGSVLSQARQSLKDMGLSSREAGRMAWWLFWAGIGAYQAAGSATKARAADSDPEVLVQVISRAAEAERLTARAVTTAGNRPGDLIALLIGRDLSPEEERTVKKRAQQFVRDQQEREDLDDDQAASGRQATAS